MWLTIVRCQNRGSGGREHDVSDMRSDLGGTAKVRG